MKRIIRNLIQTILVLGMVFGMTVAVSADVNYSIMPDPYMDGLQIVRKPNGDTNARFLVWIPTSYASLPYFEVEIYDMDGNLVMTPEANRYTLWRPFDRDYSFSGEPIGIKCNLKKLAAGDYVALIYGYYEDYSGIHPTGGNPVTHRFSLVNKNEELNGFALDYSLTTNGNYCWYENGDDVNYSGFVGSNKGVYLSGGSWNRNKEGVIYDAEAKAWKYVEFGLWVTDYDGLAEAADGTMYYFEDGKVNYDAEIFIPMGTMGDGYYIQDGIASEGCPETKKFHEYENGICKNCNKMRKSDVAEDAYYYDSVTWALQNEITKGTSATTFSPDDGCTRAQVVTFLWRAAGSPDPAGTAESFSDVPADQWYAKAVQWAVENNITQGTGNDKFSPDDTCTRAQIVTFLFRAAGSPITVGDMDKMFTDVPSTQWYADAVNWAVANNITQGTGNGKFSPDDTCTRGQIVTFLYRCYN